MGDGEAEMSFVVITVINSPTTDLILYKHCLTFRRRNFFFKF